jgi:uncharacterized protein
VIFEWDTAKAKAKRRKHGVLFQEAATTFGDPFAMTYSDPDHSESRQRFLTIGMSSRDRVLIVAHIDDGDSIRIISARKTTKREREQYEEEN